MITRFRPHAIATAITLALAGPVFAADNPSATAQQPDTKTEKTKAEKTRAEKAKAEKIVLRDNKKIEKVVVTGSRIRRDSFSVATPLVTLDREAILDTGLGSLSEILIDNMPAISEASSNTNSQSSVSTTGLSTISLRNLGTDRTLTLIDGRRVVSNSYSGNYVSMGTIPSGMVERVEIISGGASATYGSDAIAGVVNIITQQDKEGFNFKTRSGRTPEGGGKEFTVDSEFGSTFDNERGYMFVSGTWDRQFGITIADRKRSRHESSFDYNTTLLCNEMNTVDGDQCVRDISIDDWRERSDGTAGGVFEESSSGGYFYNADGLQSGWNEERDGISPYQWDNIKIPNDRFATAIKVDYDLTDSTSSYFQVQYSKNGSVNVKSPEDEYEGARALVLDPLTGDPSYITPGKIAIDNPFAPAEIADNAGSSISWDRRFFEVGNVTTDNTRTTVRSWAGLQGSMLDDEWDWDVSVGYGKFKQEQIRYNELNTLKVSQALNAQYAEDGQTIQCADADARADGCVPLNIFGEGSITPDMANWIRANPTITTDISQVNVLGYIAGDLFELPAGAVAAVFGMEYRRDSQDVRTSRGQQFGGITFNIVPTFSGDIDVWEGFAEASIPLLKDQPFAKNLSLDTSLRLAKYSPKGMDTMASYKAGIVWQPIEDVMVRANYSRSQRAPNITELMSPARGDFDSFSDICDGVSATSTDAGHDNCRLEPAIAAVIAEGGTFEDDNNGYSPNAGNESLKEETADTYTLGFSFTPSALPNFRLALDFYDIAIDDAIEEIGNEDILEQCYNSSAAWGESNSFCNDITRDNDGNIVEVMQRVFNLSETRARGYDIAAEYRYDLAEYGSLKFKADLTHVIEHSTTFEGNDGLETVHFSNQLDYGVFDDVASASLTWSKDNWRVRWSSKFKSAIVDSQDRVDDYQELFAENDIACAEGSDSCITNPEVPDYLFYPSYIKHNLSVSYTMGLDNQGQLRLFGGVNNIFDDMGPFIPRTGDNFERGIGNFDSKYDGGVGRFVYFGAELQF